MHKSIAAHKIALQIPVKNEIYYCTKYLSLSKSCKNSRGLNETDISFFVYVFCVSFKTPNPRTGF